MLKKINIIHIVLLVLDLAIIPIVGFLQGFDSPNTFIAVLCTVLIGHPMIYLVLMLVKEGLILEYDTPRYVPLCMVLTVLFGCLIWYLFFHLENMVFAQSIGLWYGCILISFALPIVIMKICEFVSSKKKSDGNGPKFIKNK